MDTIETKIEQAMHSIDGYKKAEAPGSLQAKVFAKIYAASSKSVWMNIASFISRPAVALGCIALIIAVNVAIIFSAEEEVKTYYATGIEDNRPVFDIYEIEIQEP